MWVSGRDFCWVIIFLLYSSYFYSIFFLFSFFFWRGNVKSLFMSDCCCCCCCFHFASVARSPMTLLFLPFSFFASFSFPYHHQSISSQLTAVYCFCLPACHRDAFLPSTLLINGPWNLFPPFLFIFSSPLLFVSFYLVCAGGCLGLPACLAFLIDSRSWTWTQFVCFWWQRKERLCLCFLLWAVLAIGQSFVLLWDCPHTGH